MLSRLSPVSIADFGACVWRADALACAAGATVATGHVALDAELPGGGWPVGAISEILQAQSGLHEWRLLLPALSRLTRPGTACVALVGAPQVPFGPGLCAQGLVPQRLLWVSANTPVARLWATEQALRCADVVAVLAWLSQVRSEQLRRLQIAAQTHNKLLFVLRPVQAKNECSPAVLRLLVSSQAPVGEAAADALTDALQVHILKRRGPPLARALTLPARPARLAVLLALSGAGNEGAGDALDRFAAAA